MDKSVIRNKCISVINEAEIIEKKNRNKKNKKIKELNYFWDKSDLLFYIIILISASAYLFFSLNFFLNISKNIITIKIFIYFNLV